VTTALTRPRRADVRARILEAAGQVFLRQGYAETTVSDIAAAAGFTKGAVYSNFGGKPELFSAVFAERTASIAGITIADATGLDSQATTGQTVTAVAASLTAQVTQRPSWPAALAEFRQLATHDEAVRAVYAELRLRQREQLAEQLRGQNEALGLPAGFDYAVAANLLLTVTNALATEFAAAPESTPPDLIEATLVTLLTGLLS
jgi:AcrR family transcriptional regulator